MSKQTELGISWTEETWNPIRGCSRVSKGCVECYAEKVAARFSGPGLPYEGLTDSKGRWNGIVRFVPEKLTEPLRWARPRRIFTNSMSDMFHESLSNDEIAVLFGIMAASKRHTFQVLTKRAKRMREWFKWLEEECDNHDVTYEQAANVCWAKTLWFCEKNGLPQPKLGNVLPEWPLPNVWLGVSVENQKAADDRLQHLLECPATVRWVSYEPALGPVMFDAVKSESGHCFNALEGLHWIVVGGESGTGARPFELSWADSVLLQCRSNNVAFFMKQLGADSDSDAKAKKGNIMEEWPEHLRVREYPA